MSGQTTPMSVAITLAVLALLVFRNSRPQKMTEGRFWIFPVIAVLLTGFIMYSTLSAPIPGLLVAAGIASLVGLVLGVPLGIARGHHSQVRLGDTPGTFIVDPSLVVMLIWLGAFAVRFVVRLYLPNAGAVALGATDGLVVFAISSVLTARIVIFRKYLTLAAGT